MHKTYLFSHIYQWMSSCQNIKEVVNLTSCLGCFTYICDSSCNFEGINYFRHALSSNVHPFQQNRSRRFVKTVHIHLLFLEILLSSVNLQIEIRMKKENYTTNIHIATIDVNCSNHCKF